LYVDLERDAKYILSKHLQTFLIRFSSVGALHLSPKHP
jgi:hypothetical protein